MKTKAVFFFVSAVFATVFCPASSWASTVYKFDAVKKQVYLRDVNSLELSLNMPVCLYSGVSQVGCGKITGLVKNAAVIFLKETNFAPNPGLEIAIRPSEKVPSSTASVSESFNKSSSLAMGIAAGVTAGANYFYPSLHVQVVIAREWTLGLMPMFARSYNSTSSLTGVGGYLTASYYHTHSALRGLEFELGAGAFGLSGTTPTLTQNLLAPGVKATVGWRGRALWDLGLDLGVAAGIQYLWTPANSLQITFAGLLPLLNAYVGYSF